MISRIICPQCNNTFDLQQAWDDADGRRFAELLTQLPPSIIRPFFNYLKLFKPRKRALSWARALKLTQELAPMIHAAQITRNGMLYVIPLPLWESAMQSMLHSKTLSLPLESHGYLLEILAKTADKQAAIQEYAFEEQKRQGLHRRRQAQQIDQGLQPLSTVLSPKKPKSTPPADWQGVLHKPKQDDTQ